MKFIKLIMVVDFLILSSVKRRQSSCLSPVEPLVELILLGITCGPTGSSKIVAFALIVGDVSTKY